MTTEQKITFEQTCTCGIADGDEGHQSTCQLFLSEEWFSGTATWYDGRLWDGEELWGWDDEEMAQAELKGVVEEDDDLFECDCYDDDDETVKQTSKHDAICSLNEHAAWVRGDCEWDHPTRTFVYYDKNVSTGYGDYGSYGSFGGAYKKCTHDGTTAVVFPNGVKIYPSSSHDTKNRDSVPDHALYLETSRMPYSVATYIPWTDYGLPKVGFHRAAEAIIETYGLAEAGLSVEVGCIGAHGRTGTVLACMAVIAGVHPDDAVEWVKTHHCESAVEGEKQQWFVQWFAAYLTGGVAPPSPPAPPPPPPLKKGTYATAGQTSMFNQSTGPPPTPQVGSNKGDLVKGDPCPLCHKPTVMIGGTAGNRLACNTKACINYDGLPRCDHCKVCLDAHPLSGYLCWNLHCTQFHIKSSSPAAKKGIWKKGRKKK